LSARAAAAFTGVLFALGPAGCKKNDGEPSTPPQETEAASAETPAAPKAAPIPPDGPVLEHCDPLDIEPFQEAFVRRYQCAEQLVSGMIGPGPQSHEGHLAILRDQAMAHDYEVMAEGGEIEVGDETLPVGFMYHRLAGSEELSFIMVVLTTEVEDDALLIECTVPPPESEAGAEAHVNVCTRAAGELLTMAREGTFRE
jgi:hypothetical protein